VTPSSLADSLETIVFGAVGLTGYVLAHGTPGVELSVSQWRVVVVVGDAAAPPSLGDLAARVGTTLPAMSRVVRRLERRGLIAVSHDEHDRRVLRLRLTAEGRTIRDRVVAVRRAYLEEIGDGIAQPGVPSLEPSIRALAEAFRRWA
jgi:DNA-binding MarR family transcriptional regulator